MCSPSNIDLCDDGKKKEIKKFLDMGKEELAKLIASEEKKLEEADQTFKDEVAKLQSQYTKFLASKEEAVAEVKAGGLGLMKSCDAALDKTARRQGGIVRWPLLALFNFTSPRSRIFM